MRDTSAEAATVQFAAFCRLSQAERVALALEAEVGTGRTIFTYDAQGRLTQTKHAAVSANLVSTLTYDADGRVVGREGPNHQDSLAYDAAGRIVGESESCWRASGRWRALVGALTKYMRDIAWETDAWVADSPSHMLHFNGERFLGPY